MRLDLEQLTAYASEAGVLSDTNKTRTELIYARSDIEAALAIHDLEKAEAQLAPLRAAEESLGNVEEPFSSKATLFISQALFKKLVQQADASRDAAGSAFGALVDFARRQGWPTPENCVNLALALAQYELDCVRSPDSYLEEAERWFGQVFPGMAIHQAWEKVADAVAKRHLESSLTFYLKARSAEQVLATGETSPQQEASLRMDLAKVALARAQASIESASGTMSASSDYKTAHETLAKQAVALAELLPRLDPSTAESTGVPAFLLTAIDDGPCPDPGSLCEALVQFVQAHPVSEDLTLRATFALARLLVNERPSESARAFELLYPCAQRVLSGYEWQDPQALFYYTAVTAMRSGRWTEATELLAALKPGEQGSSEDFPLWEIALMRVLTLAHAQPGKKNLLAETLESSYQEASIDTGQRHNLMRRLASVYLQDSREDDFLRMVEEADSRAASRSSGPAATGQPWHEAAPMPQANNQIQGRLLSVPVPSAYLVSRKRTEKLPQPSSLTVKALATPKLDLNVRYLQQVASEP